MAHMVSANDSERLDVELFVPGDRYTVIVGPTLRSTGWRGGTWVMYVDSDEGDFVVEASDGTKATGFLLFASENYEISRQDGWYSGSDGVSPNAWVGSSANYLAHQPATGVGGQNVVTMVNGGSRMFFKVYETVALSGGTRSGGTISYSLHDELKVSENGLLCNDSDAELALAGISTPQVVGIVSAVPAVRNGNRLCLDMKF